MIRGDINMKKTYEKAEIIVFLFEKPDTVVASGVDEIPIVSTEDNDETEIL